MRTGIPGFVGFRLTEAIEARGLSSTSLADLLGVSRSAISHYENGQHSPSPDIFERLCKIENLPPGFFMYREESESPDLIFFRSMNPAVKVAQRKAARRLNWLRNIAGHIRAYVEIHDLEFPLFSLPQNPASISDDEIDSCALELRRFWRIGDDDVGNLIRILETTDSSLLTMTWKTRWTGCVALIRMGCVYRYISIVPRMPGQRGYRLCDRPLGLTSLGRERGI